MTNLLFSKHNEDTRCSTLLSDEILEKCDQLFVSFMWRFLIKSFDALFINGDEFEKKNENGSKPAMSIYSHLPNWTSVSE